MPGQGHWSPKDEKKATQKNMGKRGPDRGRSRSEDLKAGMDMESLGNKKRVCLG